jgi:CHAT domain-containing protein/predicted negative regulator of RcsB-dependent stress response
MWGRSFKKRVNLVLFLFLFLVLSTLVFGQDEQDKLDKQLREEILSIYKSKGEPGLLDFVKGHREKISNKFIVDFADAGKKERKEVWLKVCEILAEEKKDEKALADVYYKMGTYFLLISNNKKSFESLEKSLHIYVRINDLVGQGNIFLRKGTIYFYSGENRKALEMFDKALPFYTKANNHLGQGNFYFRKGEVYFTRGNNSKALEMYDRALTFFEISEEYKGQGNVLWRKGDIYAANGNYSKALEMYDRALPFFEKEKYFLGQGNLYMSNGQIYSILNDNLNALKMFKKALVFFEKAGTLIGQGNAYWKMGDISLRKGNNSRALEMYDKAIFFLDKSGYPLAIGNLYFSKGEFYFKTGNYRDAILTYDKALNFFKKIGEPTGQGNVYWRKGDIYFKTGNNPKALEMYDKAMHFFKKCGSLLGQGNIYWRKGEIYQITGKNSEAFDALNKSLAFFEKAGNLLSQGNVYLFKGKIYYKMGDNPKALKMYDRALNLFARAQEPQGQASVYLSKGEIYHRTGDKLTAFVMYEKALPFLKKAENPIGLGNVYRNKGNLFLHSGSYLKALDMFERALIFYERTKSPLSLGNVYYDKGNIYCYFLNNYSKALDNYEKSLLFHQKAENHQGQGYVYQRLGDLYQRMGKNSKALTVYEKALPFFKSAGDPVGKGNVCLGQGEIYSEVGHYNKSIIMFENAFLLYNKSGNIESESLALHGKAKVLAKLGKRDEALDLFEKGITYFEKVRKQTAFSEMKRTLMEKVYQQFEETVLFMLENKYGEKGFKYAEAMRARVFLDRMVEGLVRLDKGLTPDLKKKQDNLLTRLSFLSKEIHETAGRNDEKKLQELKEQYNKIEGEFDELLVKIRLNNPLYSLVRYPQTVSVQYLQKVVLEKGELLLRYFTASDKIYAFLISQEDFIIVSLKDTPKDLNNSVEEYLTSIKENNRRRIKKYGKDLYKRLFKPLETSIKDRRNIIIVPDGELAKIPFEALIIDAKTSTKPVYMLENYRIKYIQSASILSILRKQYQRKGTTKHFIGFGDPVYDYENFRQGLPEHGTPNPVKGDEITEIHRGKYHREGGKLVRLKGSGEEVNTIARLFKKYNQKSVVYVREQANEANAKSPDLKEFDYIHFSCHGILGDGFQSLVLSQLPPDKTSEDGYFTLNEIMNSDYNAKLVVLSACQTGSGKMYRGEGVTGMTRAVMYAGTPAVVASLWDVDDNATKELMIHFYRNILEKSMDKAEALRQAKLELIRGKKYRSPSFWSAFVMYGE